MVVNINPETGIAYGYISASALDDETVFELMYGSGATDFTHKAALVDYLHDKANEDGFDEDRATQDFNDQYEADEPHIEGNFDGVKYATSWLGGALNFFILKSPFTTDKARRASPCVPNAGILDTLDGVYSAYDVPSDWRRTE